MPHYSLVIIHGPVTFRYSPMTPHNAGLNHLIDHEMQPLETTMVNPYQYNQTYVSNQMYGVLFTNGVPLTTNPLPGCSTSGTTIQTIDVSEIHSDYETIGNRLALYNWNLNPGGLPSGFIPHVGGSNTATSIMVRTALDKLITGAPHLLILNTATGCPITTDEMTDVATNDPSVGNTWLNAPMASEHNNYANLNPLQCYGKDPTNVLNLFAGSTFVAMDNLDVAPYIKSNISSELQTQMVTNKQFMLASFYLPAGMPITPCTGANCFITGNEPMRLFTIASDARW